MVVSAGGHRNEFNRGLLHRAFSGRISGEQFPNSFGRELLCVCRSGTAAIFSGGGDSAVLLADIVLDVSAESISEDLTGTRNLSSRERKSLPFVRTAK